MKPAVVLTIATSRFEALESHLINAGIVKDPESFLQAGASFVARGIPTHIQPEAFNGRDWQVSIRQVNPMVN
jgi:hypothetical protein